MIAFVRKNLSSLMLKYAVSFSFSLHFSSASSESQLGIRPPVYDILVHKYKFPAELASRVASELSHLKTPEKPDSVLSFFKESGFSNTQLVKIVKSKPRLLSASLEGCIKPKFKILQGEGFSSDDVAKIIATNPKILHASPENNIIPSLSVLKSLLGSTDEVAKVIRRTQRFLTKNFQNTLLPNVEILKSFGIPMERIRIILSAYPTSFTVKPETMRRYADKAIKMGLDTNSKSFVYAISTMSKMSDESWELKLQAFRDMGFSDSDIFTMFGKAPQVLYGSIEKINKVKELLLGTGKYDISCIVNCPNSLWYSMEKRYIPRLQILGILESRSLIKKWPGLGDICRLTDDKFSDRFIRPYQDEVSDVYGAKRSARGKKGTKL